jgi:hypothetical protein
VPILLVKRPFDAGGILRRLIVEVDGQVVARLRQGEQEAIPVEPGERMVQARMDWCTSAPLHVTLTGDERRTVVAALPLRALRDMVVRPRRALNLRLA